MLYYAILYYITSGSIIVSHIIFLGGKACSGAPGAVEGRELWGCSCRGGCGECRCPGDGGRGLHDMLFFVILLLLLHHMIEYYMLLFLYCIVSYSIQLHYVLLYHAMLYDAILDIPFWKPTSKLHTLRVFSAVFLSRWECLNRLWWTSTPLASSSSLWQSFLNMSSANINGLYTWILYIYTYIYAYIYIHIYYIYIATTLYVIYIYM